MRSIDVMMVEDLQCLKSLDGKHEWIQENRFSYRCARCGTIQEKLD
jgi:hypothetical protein